MYYFVNVIDTHEMNGIKRLNIIIIISNRRHMKCPFITTNT